MPVDVSSLSQLSTATFHLKLLDQGLEQLKDPKYQTSPLAQTVATTGPVVYDSTKTIQLAIDTIQTFRDHIHNLSPKAKAIAPKILKNATSQLNKIKQILGRLPPTLNKNDLSTSIESCRAAIIQAKDSLGAIQTSETQTTLGVLSRIGAVLANAAYSLLNPVAELDRINMLILDYKKNLKDISKSEDPLHFADSVSQFVMSYLEEELVHVKERDISLRPSFLEYFFDNLYSNDPKENDLCILVKNALTDNKPLMKATIELNLLKGLHQAYSTLQAIESKPFLIDLMQNSFHIAIESVRKEEEARKHGGINPLTLEERNRLLIGTFQKELVQFILDLAFPKGAEELELPEIISSKIPLVKNAMTDVKTQRIWPLLQQGLGDLCQSIFSELSTDEDVKTQILMEGYSQANAFLERKAVQASTPITRLSKLSALSVGIVTVFFSVIFNAFKKKTTEESSYPHQKELNDDLYKAMEWVAEGSNISKFIFKHYGRRIADSAGSSITQALKNIKVSDFLNQQLASIATVLSPEDEATLFPRTEQAEEAIKEARDKTKELNKETLKELRRAFRNNIDGLISQITDAIYPPLDEAQLSRVRVVWRQFLRSCLFYLIRFVSLVIRAKRHIGQMEQRFYQAVHRMDQDAILMAVTRGGSEKILEAKKKLPKEG